MFSKDFFTPSQQESIQASIATAELNTSGEIRLHVDDKCSGDPVAKAIKVFEKLKMHETELRNGVLIYVAIKDKKLAILGDKGINEAVSDDFWDAIKNDLVFHFKEGKYTEGLVEGIHASGEQLKAHFPYQSDDTNELSNDISFGADQSK
ncbi:TPM domain-containing protein [Crocinitomicaceae bacterium]|nr:TPM domain-containing protein [Crocinitomicaceae bacterium]